MSAMRCAHATPTSAPETARGRMRTALGDMLSPQHVAVVGASESNFYTSNAIRRLREEPSLRLSLVNPNRDSVFGMRTFRSMADIPERPDVVLRELEDRSAEEHFIFGQRREGSRRPGRTRGCHLRPLKRVSATGGCPTDC